MASFASAALTSARVRAASATAASRSLVEAILSFCKSWMRLRFCAALAALALARARLAALALATAS
jgi:hypothetical protein